MRRAHATGPEQRAMLPLGGFFDPNDIALDAEVLASCRFARPMTKQAPSSAACASRTPAFSKP
jgi:hypothetical protein